MQSLEGIPFVKVCASTFAMGCTSGQPVCARDETVHFVTLTHDYSVGVTEVTQAQFEATMGYNPSGFWACGNTCPVEDVSWHESAAYTNALSAAAGLSACYTCTGTGTAVECEATADPHICDGYRLLTEAEWEGAARCGEDLRYAGSDSVADVAWYSDNSGSTPHLVAGKLPNACGLYDMSGNVQEWTQDWYGALGSTAAVDPPGASAGSYRVDRGGGWSNDASYTRVAYRGSGPPAGRSSNVGFRLTRSILLP